MKQRKLDMSFIDDDLLLPINDIWWDEEKVDYYLLVIDIRCAPPKDLSSMTPYEKWLSTATLRHRDKVLY